MIFNFEFFLTFLVVTSGLIVVIDYGWRKLRYQKKPMPVKGGVVVEYAQSFFPILLLVLLLRSFLIEPFRIPTGSLEPTLLVGDFIVVNKYHYGLRLPVFGTKFYQISEPKRGDIVVFRFPLNPKVDFVKRVVGLPGDHISYIDKVLYVNGKPASQIELAADIEGGSSGYLKNLKQENLLGVKHQIFLRDDLMEDDFEDIVVPPAHYFMMGDNRDESSDSRSWGFVPEKNLIGQAQWIWLSVDTDHYRLRFKRIGQKIS
jgi:signal peptidase I